MSRKDFDEVVDDQGVGELGNFVRIKPISCKETEILFRDELGRQSTKCVNLGTEEIAKKLLNNGVDFMRAREPDFSSGDQGGVSYFLNPKYFELPNPREPIVVDKANPMARYKPVQYSFSKGEEVVLKKREIQSRLNLFPEVDQYTFD